MSEPRAGEAPRRLGLGMIATAWILVLGLLTAYFAGYLDRQHNPNQAVEGRIEGGVREVVLQQNRGGHYVATGRINGEPVRFLLDTGATEVSVPAALARDLGLPQGPAQSMMTANGVVTAYSTVLDRVELGTIRLDDVRAHINPHMGGRDVLLGMSFLRNLEFVQRNRSLTLRQHAVGS